MIALRLLRLSLASAAIFSGSACAVGLGDINLHSRIGETLRADIPVLAGGEAIDSSCFSIGQTLDADLPTVHTARIRVVRFGQDYRLILTSSKPVDEPLVLISIRAACGYDLKRDYVLMPAPPESSANDIDVPTMAAAGPVRQKSTRRRSPTETGAASLADNSDSSDRSARRLTKSANPARSLVNKPKPSLPRDTLAGLSSGLDRVVLGAAHDDLPATSANDPLAPVNELDERILKMETTLHLLNQEVDKLNSAITLAAESRAMREKLQGLQAQQVTAPSTLLPNAEAALATAPARTSPSGGWLELLFGLLLGGSISAGVAYLVSHKQAIGRTFDAPMRIAKPRPSKS